MQLTLDVVASLRIRRKKPWSRLAWIGREKESVLLIDDRRVSVLFIPSGKTKRKITKLQPFLKDCIGLNYTKDGSSLFGLHPDGAIFVWHKDDNTILQLATKYPGLIPNGSTEKCIKWRPSLFASDDCRKILCVITDGMASNVEIYLYNGDKSERWWRIEANLESALRVGKELVVDACFVEDHYTFDPVVMKCGFAYTTQSSVRFVVLSVTNLLTGNGSSLVHRWSSVDLPIKRISSTARLPFRKGSYLVKWSYDGRLAAIIVNENDVDNGRVLLASTECSVLISVSIPSECINAKITCDRLDWICDAQWTHDDLFLVVIRRTGSVSLLCRSGEMLSIATQGCSMDLPFSLSLPIHPRVFVRNSTQIMSEDSTVSSTTTGNILRQRFSVTCHPRQPMFFCSDGYMVTCLMLPPLVSSPHKAVYFFLRESHKNIKRLRRLFYGFEKKTLDSSSIPIESNVTKNSFNRTKPRVSWEQPIISDDDIDDDSVCQSELAIHRLSAIGKADHGTLLFGALDDQSSIQQRIITDVNLVSNIEIEVVQSLMAAWSIVVATNDTWTIEWETRAKSIADLLVNLCRIKCHVVESVTICKRFILVGRLDGSHKNTLLVTLNTIKRITKTLLNSIVKNQQSIDVQLKSLDSIVRLLSSSSDMIVATFSYDESWSAFDDCFVSTCGHNYHKDTSSKSLVTVRSRLISSWHRIHRVISRLYLSFTSEEDTDNYYDKLVNILSRVQFEIQRCGQSVKELKRIQITSDQRRFLLVADEREGIISKWIQKVAQIFQDVTTLNALSLRQLSRQLHAILYSYLSAYNIKEAMEFAIWLLMTIHKSEVTDHRSEAIRQTLRTFGRFMSSYFLNRPLVIAPWHRPRPLRSQNPLNSTTNRMIKLNRDWITSGVRHAELDRNWTPDVAVALLLITGCIMESADLALSIGDWKTSFVMNSIRLLDNNKANSRAGAQLCDLYVGLSMKTIFGLNGSLTDDLSILADDISDVALSHTLEDCFLVGSLCGLDVVSSILHCLLSETKMLLMKLDNVYVSDDIYLPRPPIYCPQLKEPTVDEDHVLARVASILRLVRVSLSASHCVGPVVRCYLKDLCELALKTTVSNEHLQDWPLIDHLRSLQDTITSNDEYENIAELVDCFRDFCSIAWFLHARDKASRHLRRFHQMLESRGCKSKKSKTSSKMGLHVLQWLVRMLPFAEFMNWSLEVYDCILSVLMDMPPDNRASAVLARCFPDSNSIPDELEYRITRLKNTWHGVSEKVPSKNETILINTYVEQGIEMTQIMEELQKAVGPIEENVFLESTFKKCRPFEVDWEYYVFLELMLDIGFLKDVSGKGTLIGSLPLLSSNRALLIKKYLLEAPLESSSFNHRRISVSTGFSIDLSRFSVQPKSHAKIGLFRSLSLNEQRSRVDLQPMTSTRNKAKSLTNPSENELLTTSKISADIIYICEDIATYTISHTNDTRRDCFDKLLRVLSRWANKDDCISGLPGHCLRGPRIKVKVSVGQILAAICRTLPRVEDTKRIKESSSKMASETVERCWSPPEVTHADLLTSTPVSTHVQPVPESEITKLNDTTSSWRTISQSSQKIVKNKLAVSIDPQSDYISRLQKLQDVEDMVSDSSTLGISSLSSDDIDKKMDSLGSVIDVSIGRVLHSQNTNKSKSVTVSDSTSRWTSSKAIKKHKQATTNESVSQSTTLFEDESVGYQCSPSDLDFVNETTKGNWLKRRNAFRRTPKKIDDSSSISSGAPVRLLRLPAEHKSSKDQSLCDDLRATSTKHRKAKIHHYHQYFYSETNDEDNRATFPEGYVPPLLRLQTPTSLKLIPPDQLRKFEPKIELKTRTKLSMRIPEFKELAARKDPLRELTEIFKESKEIGVDTFDLSLTHAPTIDNDQLPSEVSSKNTIEFGVGGGTANLLMKNEHAIQKDPLLTREFRENKIEVGVGTSDTSFKKENRHVQTNTNVICSDVAINTDDLIVEKKLVSVGSNCELISVDVGVGSNNILLTPESSVKSFSSLGLKGSQADRIESAKSRDRKTQTEPELVLIGSKKSFSSKAMVHSKSNGKSNEILLAALDCTSDSGGVSFNGNPDHNENNKNGYSREKDLNTGYTSELDGTAMASGMTQKLHKEMINTKKFIERLECQELENLLNRPFPTLAPIRMAQEHEISTEQRWTYAKELVENDYFVDDDVRKQVKPPQESSSVPQQNVSSSPDRLKEVSNENMTSRRMEEQKSELRAWMQRKSSQRRKDFRRNLESLRSLERQPFVSSKQKSVTDRDIAQFQEERENKNVKRMVSHFSTRKEEALKLLQELQTDEVKVPLRTRTRLHPSINQEKVAELSKRKNCIYVLNRGLIPLDISKEEIFNLRKKSKASNRPLSVVSQISNSDASLTTWSLQEDVRRIIYGDNFKINEKDSEDTDAMSDISGLTNA